MEAISPSSFDLGCFSPIGKSFNFFFLIFLKLLLAQCSEQLLHLLIIFPGGILCWVTLCMDEALLSSGFGHNEEPTWLQNQ